MGLADQLTVARMALAPAIVVLYVVDFSGHDYWATALFAVAMATDWFDGRIARRSGRTSAMGSLLDPVADNVLVGVVLSGRDLGKLKTWTQSVAAFVGGLAAAGVWRDEFAWWALLAALIVTWVSGLDYARVAPRLLRSRTAV